MKLNFLDLTTDPWKQQILTGCLNMPDIPDMPGLAQSDDK